MKTKILALGLPILLLAACADDPQDQIQDDAQQSAIAAGATPAALGLTELQLLDADVYGVAGGELGEVQQIVRSASGEVIALLVEIEDSDPDRFVRLPLDGMAVMKRGADTDISAPLTRRQLMAMPEIDLTVK